MKKNKRKRKSIYSQIISVYLSIYIIFSISLSLAGYYIPKIKITAETFEDLISETNEFYIAYTSSPDTFQNFLNSELEGEGDPPLVISISFNGKTLYENMKDKLPDSRKILRKEKDLSIFISNMINDKNKYVFIEKDFPNNISILIGEDFSQIDNIFNLIRNILIILNIISIILLTVILTITTKKLLFPIKELSSIIRKIPVNEELLINLDYSEYPKEIYQFAERFDSMLSRIKNLINETRDISNSVAHDIKTPITNIKMITEDLLTESKGQNKEKLLSLIDNLDRTTYIIDSIMSVAGILSQTKQNKIDEINLIPIIEDACELFYDISEEKNISIDFKYTDNDNDIRVCGNTKSVQRIISNLLDNAIKYTQENGSIKIIIEEKKHHTDVIIKDSGIGIPKDEINNIFKKFYKVDKSRGSLGIGLGLHTVKILLDQINGSISCKSSTGKGSIFTLSFKRYKK